MNFRKDVGHALADVERAYVATYLRIKGLPLTKRSFLRQYLADTDSGLVSRCERILRRHGANLGIETLIDLFELLVACETRKKNGVTYTPLAVKKNYAGPRPKVRLHEDIRYSLCRDLDAQVVKMVSSR